MGLENVKFWCEFMLELIFLLAIAPLLQFVLINANTNKMIYGGIPFGLCFFGPFYYRNLQSFRFVNYCCFLLYTYLRILDIALQPTEAVRSWTIFDYLEYFFALYTKDQREKIHDQASKYAVPYSRRTARYYGKLFWKVFAQYLAFSALVWYGQTFPAGNDLPYYRLLRPNEIKGIVDNVVFGLTLSLMVQIQYALVFGPITHFFRSSFESVMINPFLSTSFRDFWSNRWNMAVKMNLQRIGFVPVWTFCRWITGLKEGDKSPAWHGILAALGTFVLSGFIHEWIIVAATPEGTRFEQFTFFLVHGLITISQVLLEKLIKKHFGSNPFSKLPNVVCVAITWILFLLTTPLFVNPWRRINALNRIRIPAIQELIQMI